MTDTPPQYPGQDGAGQTPPSYGSTPPPAGGYPPPPGHYPAAPGGYQQGPRGNQLALWSMIVGIMSIPLLCCYAGFFTGIAAVVMGFIAKNQIRDAQGGQTGGGQALAGIICGATAIALTVLGIVLFFAIGFSGGFDSY